MSGLNARERHTFTLSCCLCRRLIFVTSDTEDAIPRPSQHQPTSAHYRTRYEVVHFACAQSVEPVFHYSCHPRQKRHFTTLCLTAATGRSPRPFTSCSPTTEGARPPLHQRRSSPLVHGAFTRITEPAASATIEQRRRRFDTRDGLRGGAAPLSDLRLHAPSDSAQALLLIDAKRYFATFCAYVLRHCPLADIITATDAPLPV